MPTPPDTIEKLAAFLGWKKEEYVREEHYCCGECGKCNESCKPRTEWRWRVKEGHPAYDGNTVGPWWNPLEKWDDFRMLEEKIIATPSLANRLWGDPGDMQRYIYADLPTKCDDLLSALSSRR